MNPHAGWSNSGLCVLCGTSDPGDECDFSSESMLNKIEKLNSKLSDQKFIIQDLIELLEKVLDGLNVKDIKDFVLAQKIRKAIRLYGML